MGTTTAYDTIIVGAGAIGCCAAVHLAPDHDVLVLEKDDIGESASANASAHISDWWFFLEGEYIPEVTEILRDFFANLDGTGEFRFHERDFLTLVDEEDAESPETVKMKNSAERIAGISYYDVQELQKRYPDVLNLDRFVGGFVDEQAGYVNPQSYLFAMKSVAEQDGAEFRTGTEVTDIFTEQGSVTGVEVEERETVTADSVVVAAGTHTKELVSDFVDLPVRPFVIYEAQLRGHPSFADELPTTAGRGTLIGSNTDGNLLVGDEYWVSDIESIPNEFPDEAREKIAKVAPQLFTVLDDDLEYIEGTAHKCPEGITITSDQIPVIDMLDDAEGLVVADGSRGAVSLAPAISVAIRSILTGSETPFSLERFAVDRFDSEVPNFDLPMITTPK